MSKRRKKQFRQRIRHVDLILSPFIRKKLAEYEQLKRAEEEAEFWQEWAIW